MSRDYKHSTSREKPSSKGNPFLSGLLVGLLLGVGISVGMALVITGGESPFVNKVTPAAVIEADKNARPDAAEPPADSTAEEKPRFDFYTILPGSEKQVTEQEIKQKEAQSEAIQSETYFLQVGAFQTEKEADNMKAKLALQGMEAIVQTAEIPDKGIWHRVRVGPFTDLNQINAARSELVQNGFTADLIKVNSNVPNQ
ncbi:hypothetical protein MTYP_01558 [Methylophilaceae bacterium]|nr:hypothetical protein MTYP_01558 [Methylophilaceae bacterium]